MLTIEQVQQIGIPERYIGSTRKDFPSSSQILNNVQDWLKNGDLVIFQGNRAAEFLAVLAKYIVGEFNLLVKWVDFLQLQTSYHDFDEDGRRKIFYYTNFPVIVVPDISLVNDKFDFERFVKGRWLNRLPTFCSVFGQFYAGFRLNVNHKNMHIGEE